MRRFNFFRRLRFKVSATIAAILQTVTSSPIWTPARFDKLAEEGFSRNVWVYRCVMVTAQHVASVPLLLYQKRGKKLVEIETHPLLDLLNKPNPLQSKHEFLESWAAFLLLSGNSYIEMNGPNRGAPTELWAWRPDRTTIIPGGDNLIQAYRYTVNGRYVDVPAERIIHNKFFAPLDDFYGLGPIQVAARVIDQDNAANAWNAALLQNSGRPSGAFLAKKPLNDKQFERTKYQLRQEYAGANSAGKIMLLEGDVDWKEMSLSPRDMDFIESKKMNRLEICAVFGVPPELVGDHEHATYSNYKEARASFYIETVLPLLDKLIDKLNAQLVPLFGDDLVLAYDTDQIPALQENLEVLWKRAIEGLTNGMLELNEARQMVGYGNIKGGNVRYIPATFIQVDEDGSAVSAEGTDDSNETMEESPSVEETDDVDETEESPMKRAEEIFIKAVASLKSRQFINDIERRREGFIKAGQQIVRKRFAAEKKEVLKVFDNADENTDIVAAIEKVIDGQRKEWEKALAAIWLATAEEFAKHEFERLQSQAKGMQQKFFDEEFAALNAIIQKYIFDVVADAVTKVTKFTKELLKHVIGEGVARGESLLKIAKRIENVYTGDFDKNRSITIARTEVISASNYGNHMGAKATGLPLEKEWVAVLDSRTRDDHADAHGQVRDIDDYYDVGGEKAMYPR
ncbi:phage portal protein [Parageobacillus thermoglucosidasius]|uniref:phage portal protein n=1 Tax=Parageobacillus thermoglucosidasius TaxID=1426 RepID=UPI002E1D46BF|nr:phage portal protein [Parageobacillus thermoglucosidasius]MED4914367.1 phage portal protein [Parageobacillus thermoglucosidasius]MED4946491.1 phage portal protein [Parageobacillus thermoglucosidasius]MED4984052.1 phage portal protein [Parageobacillus thermoglucosidasius]